MKRALPEIAVVAGILLCLSACQGHGGHGHENAGREEDSAHEKKHEEQGHAGHGPGEEGHDGGLQLTLNDGEKWPVDEPTRESAARLVSLFESAGAADTLEEARALGETLDQELDTLVKGCRMTGPAHDQLHIFLVALFPNVEALKKETDAAALERARDEIGSLLEAYAKHFE